MGDSNWTNKKVDKFVVVNNLLGEGAFGKVYRGFFTNEDSKQVACKVIPIQAISDSTKYLDLIKREISILQKLTHNKYIVKLYDVARTNNNLYIFLEYCQDGDLKEYIKTKGHLSESEATLFFKHICEGFKDLDKKNIIHRDIKPANLLLHEGSIKISDFGFSRTIENSSDPAKYSRLGSPLYMAPQILEGTAFNSKCDIWSVGIVFFEMLYGATPWMAKDQNQLLKNIKTKSLTFPNNPPRSEKVKDILRGMLKVNEEERLSWEQLFNHPLLQEPKPEPSLANNQDIQKEDLELQKMNEQYLEKHRVAGYLNTNIEKVPEKKPDNDMTPSELVGQAPGESAVNNEELLSDTSKMIQYNNEKEFRKSMQKMNKFILLERNIAFFFKNTLKTVFSYYWSQKLKIDSELYNRVIFCLCKCQTINLEKVTELVKEDKSTCFSDQALWQKYKETKEFAQTCKLIQQDKEHSIKFYQELSKRTKDALEKEMTKDASKKPQLEKFLQNLNSKFIMDQQFKEAYKTTLKELVSILAPQVKNNQDVSKEIMVLLRYIIVSQNPFNEFNGSETDFNSFYEEVENLPPAKLREDLLKRIN